MISVNNYDVAKLKANRLWKVKLMSITSILGREYRYVVLHQHSAVQLELGQHEPCLQHDPRQPLQPLKLVPEL